jgi:PAS domain S-box-containing protein
MMDLEHVASVGVTLAVSVPTTAVLFRWFIGNLKQQNKEYLERITRLENINDRIVAENIRLTGENGLLRGQRDRMSGAESVAIVSANKSGIITKWSRGAEELLGWTSAEIVGQPITTLIWGRDMEKHLGGFDGVTRGERKIDPKKAIEIVARHKEGRAVPLTGHYSSWPDPITKEIWLEAVFEEGHRQ